MKNEIRDKINNYKTAEFLLKHKDAVKVAVGILEDYMDIDETDIEWICNEFEQKCYLGNDTWNNEDSFNNGYWTAIEDIKEKLNKWERN